MRSMQSICTLRITRDYEFRCTLGGTRQLEPEDALSEVGEPPGKSGDAGVAEQFAAGPANACVTKAALTKELGPVLRLAVLEPFDVGRHGIAHGDRRRSCGARHR